MAILLHPKNSGKRGARASFPQPKAVHAGPRYRIANDPAEKEMMGIASMLEGIIQDWLKNNKGV